MEIGFGQAWSGPCHCPCFEAVVVVVAVAVVAVVAVAVVAVAVVVVVLQVLHCVSSFFIVFA